MNGLKRFFVYVFVLAFILSLGVFASAITPSGASTIVSVSNSTAPTTSPTSQEAIAGNVSEISIEGVSTTQSWQGYFGNVTGAIRLADASANVMYNWSIANPSGEVYASTSNSVAWGSIACFDWATNGVALETSYGIGADDADGVNETFATGNGHDEFYTAGTQFTSGTCMSTKVYDELRMTSRCLYLKMGTEQTLQQLRITFT
ncbi:hypothetical protein B6U91_02395 [Candidatus Pacearchaeota archaeon ex4484_71]|nr:MAG: hypothetical protein B6U91_02395 [Candidatus Pacearchaeota archaeon ex4484_71]